MFTLIDNKTAGFRFSYLSYNGGKSITVALPHRKTLRYMNHHVIGLEDIFFDSAFCSGKKTFISMHLKLLSLTLICSRRSKSLYWGYDIPDLVLGKEKRCVEPDEEAYSFLYTHPDTGYVFRLTEASFFLKRPRHPEKREVKRGWWVQEVPNEKGEVLNLHDSTLVVTDMSRLHSIIQNRLELRASIRTIYSYSNKHDNNV